VSVIRDIPSLAREEGVGEEIHIQITCEVCGAFARERAAGLEGWTLSERHWPSPPDGVGDITYELYIACPGCSSPSRGTPTA
jgi:hypothetical protein